MRHVLKNYVSVVEFARMKNVYPTTMYNAIKRGDLIIVLAGKAKHQWIDGEKYKDYQPPKRKDNAATVVHYFRKYFPKDQ
jgi:hypothetical protein